MHNASRSLQRRVSTIQSGEPIADDDVFELPLLEKHALYHPPHPVFLLLLRIYNLRTCHPLHKTSSLVGMFVLLYFNTYTSILAQASVLSFKKRVLCVVCSVLCVQVVLWVQQHPQQSMACLVPSGKNGLTGQTHFSRTDDGREVWISDSGSTMRMTAGSTGMYGCFPSPGDNDQVILGGLAMLPIAC